MTHPEYIDPNLARRTCTPDELEIIHARNQLLSWTQIGQMTNRSRGIVKRIHGQANRKVNGGYVPVEASRPTKEEKLAPGYVKPPTKGEMARAMRATDPDWLATKRGIPLVGTPKVRGFRRPELPPR